MADRRDRHTELAQIRRPDVTKERLEELAEARIAVRDIGSYDCILVPITRNGRLCSFMTGRVHKSLPVPTLAPGSIGLRRFGKKYIFAAICGADLVLDEESAHKALYGALVVASTEHIECIAVPVFGLMGAHLATLEATARGFSELAEEIGIFDPQVVFTRDP